MLRDILTIVLSKSIQPGAPELLKILIKEHHEIYIKCFHENLKPKFHFMLHYPCIISQIGPLPQTWSMGLEQKHKEFKKIGKVITCRINLIESFAIKEQLFCANFLLNNDFVDEIKKEPTTKIAIDAIKKYKKENNFENNIYVTKWIIANGKKFKNSKVIQIKPATDVDMPCFALIKDIFLVNNCFYFGCQILETISFCRFFYSYIVEYTENFILFIYEELLKNNTLLLLNLRCIYNRKKNKKKK